MSDGNVLFCPGEGSRETVGPRLLLDRREAAAALSISTRSLWSISYPRGPVPVVRIRGPSMDKSGTPFDCFEQLYRATEFAFAISGSTSRQLFPTPGFQDWKVRPLPDAPSP